ncbi:MAG TPA: polysaccharide pyruvyl transferase family protein [Burkholderiales bacterium]|nr:polysaccharide pyruvyl transferase family protein [Burkholderiales bacterium]
MKPRTIGLYGNFGAGNLGNECTLQAVIEQTLLRWPEAQLLCFCTNPQDVRTRHNIAAFHSEAVDKSAAGQGAGASRGRIARMLRIVFRRIPLELLHWVRSLRAVARTDMMIVAGTGIVADYMCGPLGWPYDIFKLSVLAALCRVRFVFLSVGVGPISHPLSRWFLKRSLTLAYHRSYRDVASRQYLEKIGFDTGGDFVYPDVVFGLSSRNLVPAGASSGARRIIGLGLKDYGATDRIGSQTFRAYLDTMATFVSFLHGRGYRVRLLIGDIEYDSWVIGEFVDVLRSRNIATDESLLITERALTVRELLRQLGETEAVISARYHNLVMALIQTKPVMALADHAKLDSLVSDFGLAHYRLPLGNLSADTLIGRFTQLETDVERLQLHIRAELDKYRQALDVQYAALFGDSDRGARAADALR